MREAATEACIIGICILDSSEGRGLKVDHCPELLPMKGLDVSNHADIPVFLKTVVQSSIWELESRDMIS